MAYQLLGEFKAARVLADTLSDKDKQNIAALLTDEKYLSLLKLQQNIVAQWIQQCVHEEGNGQNVKKGGIMMYSTIQQAVVSVFKQRMQNDAEEGEINRTLNGLGW